MEAVLNNSEFLKLGGPYLLGLEGCPEIHHSSPSEPSGASSQRPLPMASRNILVFLSPVQRWPPIILCYCYCALDTTWTDSLVCCLFSIFHSRAKILPCLLLYSWCLTKNKPFSNIQWVDKWIRANSNWHFHLPVDGAKCLRPCTIYPGITMHSPKEGSASITGSGCSHHPHGLGTTGQQCAVHCGNLTSHLSSSLKQE